LLPQTNAARPSSTATTSRNSGAPRPSRVCI
jgi:hypothetical protein